MSTTVQYKGNTLATVSNDTKTLKTAGKYMEGDVVLTDVSGGTGAISVVDTTDTHGGTIRTITAVDISDTTAVANDVAQGKYFYTADGTKTEGTSTGGSGGIVLLGTDEVTVSTTNTSVTTEKTCSIPIDSKVAYGLILCLVQDKAGKRNNYFYSSITAMYGNNPTIRSWTERITNTGSKGVQASGYGVYASGKSYSGGILTATISSRYSSTYSLTIDGTYSIKFYYIDTEVL